MRGLDAAAPAIDACLSASGPAMAGLDAEAVCHALATGTFRPSIDRETNELIDTDRRRLPWTAILAAGLISAGLMSTGLTSIARAETKTIFEIPPIQWDRLMLRDRPAQFHGPTELGRLTGGIVFGQSPGDVNARLPSPAPGIEWMRLSFAIEYSEDIRYFWTRLDAMRELRDGLTGCVGAGSYIVFLFREHGLLRMSWRLLPDAACPSTEQAAEGLYARYLSIDARAALASHYRAGPAHVVEITDPNMGYLVPVRWQNRQRR